MKVICIDDDWKPKFSSLGVKIGTRLFFPAMLEKCTVVNEVKDSSGSVYYQLAEYEKEYCMTIDDITGWGILVYHAASFVVAPPDDEDEITESEVHKEELLLKIS